MFLFDSFKETKVDFHMNFTHSLMKKLITPVSLDIIQLLQHRENEDIEIGWNIFFPILHISTWSIFNIIDEYIEHTFV